MKLLNWRFVFYKTVLLLITLFIELLSQSNSPILREEKTIIVDSKIENWRLEWRTKPQLACDPNDEDWYTCPCQGFAYGEKGELDLVRQNSGLPEERLSLTSFFKDADMSSPLAILPKWPVYDNDIDIKDSIRFFEIIKQRPIVKILNIADYDHDGRSTEFILQVGAQSCGHEQTILVGISKNNPSLHVFGSIAHPNLPLTFQRPEIWKALLQSKGDTTVVEWPCGDHGAEEEDRIEFHTTLKGIQVFRLLYSCESKYSAQKLISREEL